MRTNKLVVPATIFNGANGFGQCVPIKGAISHSLKETTDHTRDVMGHSLEEAMQGSHVGWEGEPNFVPVIELPFHPEMQISFFQFRSFACTRNEFN